MHAVNLLLKCANHDYGLVWVSVRRRFVSLRLTHNKPLSHRRRKVNEKRNTNMKKRWTNNEFEHEKRRKKQKQNKSRQSCLPCLLFSYCLCLYCLSVEKLKIKEAKRVRDARSNQRWSQGNRTIYPFEVVLNRETAKTELAEFVVSRASHRTSPHVPTEID